MAEVKRLLGLRHIRSDNGFHLLYFKRGTLRRSGRGLAFWFLPMSASMAEIPIVDQNATFGFSIKTGDFQDVSVQGAVLWRVIDPARVSERFDFSIDLGRGSYLDTPLEDVASRFIELAQQFAESYVSATPLFEVLQHGHEALRTRLATGLMEAQDALATGIEVVAVRITAIRAKPEVEKAMEAPKRESIQQAADEAAFARRALAVEKERAIKENELKNKIELAKRDEQLIAQQGANERLRASEQGEALRITTEANITQSRLEATSQAENTQTLARAEAERIALVESATVEAERARLDAQLQWERGRLEAMRDVPPHVIYGIAAQQLAGKLERIEHLSLSPDILMPALTRLLDSGSKRLEGK